MNARQWPVVCGVALLLATHGAAHAAPVTIDKPALLTAAGQSSDIVIAKVMLNTRLKLGLDVNPLATSDDLGTTRSMVVVLGASTKGLGAAGLNFDKETARVTALLKSARDRGIKIVALHTGGAARRGKTSDDLIRLVVPQSDCVVVVAAGNKDALFTTLAAERTIPVVEVETVAAAGDAVQALFVR
jgi:hypothetical protein